MFFLFRTVGSEFCVHLRSKIINHAFSDEMPNANTGFPVAPSLQFPQFRSWEEMSVGVLWR